MVYFARVTNAPRSTLSTDDKMSCRRACLLLFHPTSQNQLSAIYSPNLIRTKHLDYRTTNTPAAAVYKVTLLGIVDSYDTVRLYRNPAPRPCLATPFSHTSVTGEESEPGDTTTHTTPCYIGSGNAEIAARSARASTPPGRATRASTSSATAAGREYIARYAQNAYHGRDVDGWYISGRMYFL